jgi:hypothetical protein
MKTVKIFSVLSLALLFSVITAISGNPGNKGDRIVISQVIKHHVNITLPDDHKICNFYQVEILNEKGQLVAPAKPFVQGVSEYDFYERGPATGKRIALLVLSPVYSHFSCDRELFTAPAVAEGPFMAGSTYRYDLFPQSQQNKE